MNELLDHGNLGLIVGLFAFFGGLLVWLKPKKKNDTGSESLNVDQAIKKSSSVAKFQKNEAHKTAVATAQTTLERPPTAAKALEQNKKDGDAWDAAAKARRNK